ncbi:protein tyrosine phosphatase domain-containing protein 1-like [Lineus longissimus]|uniref:protein tyrosine phosphatase domain-containing protein 1-like n=1 Tax=Lineus longissimus TaxID=88925 RepID=UPI002B4D4EA8
MAATYESGGLAAFDYSFIAEDIDWDSEVEGGKTAKAAYGALSEALRRGIPEDKMCALFCRGKHCKYDRSDCWSEEQMEIKGLFSNWITENILAMARPSTAQITEFKIIDQFKDAGIKSVISLQTPGEHAACGKLEEGGLVYNPQIFMDNEIFFYNFAWPDYGTGSMRTLLDMVRVFQFAISQGKVAVHCHAGLGRTGVLIGSYLIFNNRMTADEVVNYIRTKRPKSIQTSGQIECLKQFTEHLTPFRVVFSSTEEAFNDFTLSQHLTRQRGVLHGYEARRLKYLPKVIFVCCERLLELAHSSHSSALHDQTDTISYLKAAAPRAFPGGNVDDSVSMDSRQASTLLDDSSDSDKQDSDSFAGDFTAKPSLLWVAQALAATDYTDEVKETVKKYKYLLNGGHGIWKEFSELSDPHVLSSILWDWMDHLLEPIIRTQDLTCILQHMDQPEEAFQRLEKGGHHVTEYLIQFIAKLQPIPDALEDILMHHLISVLTHHNVYLDNEKFPLEISRHTTSHRFLKGERLLGIMKIFYANLDAADKKYQLAAAKKSREERQERRLGSDLSTDSGTSVQPP